MKFLEATLAMEKFNTLCLQCGCQRDEDVFVINLSSVCL